MSKLNEMIANFCPDGVEYSSIGSLITRIRERAKDDKNVQQVYAVSNSMGMVKAEEFRENTIHSEDTSNYTVIRPGMFAYNPSRLNIGSIAMLKSDEPGLVSPMYVVFSIDNNKITNEYFEYSLKSSFVKNKIDSLKEEGARFRFDFDRWDWIRIAVPPIEVQQEIVRILDIFIALEAELEAELEIRKKQYSHYSNLLLTSSHEIEKKSLGEIANFRRGSFPQPYGESRWYDGEDAMPFVQVVDVTEGMRLVEDTKRKISKLAQSKSVFVPTGTVVVTLQGSIGRVAITQYDSYLDRTLAIFESYKVDINKKYFAYQLKRKFGFEKETARGSTIKTITKEEFTDFEIPVPSIIEQERIVEALECFDALCNDMTQGLPAEIAARRKQYEYYRDKLLTFKEKMS